MTKLSLAADDYYTEKDYYEEGRRDDCIQGVLSLDEDESFADRQVGIESESYWWNTYCDTEREALNALREPSKEKKGKDITPSESKYMRRSHGGKQKFGPPPRKC